MNPIILLGTVHRHPQGPSLLAAALVRLAPTILSLEMSPYARAFRRTRGRGLAARLEAIVTELAREQGVPREALAGHRALVAIRDLLALPFEYRVSAAYAARRGIALHLSDDSAVSRTKLALVERELITPDNLRALLALPADETPREGYASARRLLRDDVPRELRQAFLAGRRGAEGIGPRDRRMAAVLRALCRSGSGQTVLHIGGWVHLIEDEQGETLYSLVRDLGPQRRLLEGVIGEG